MIYNIDDIRPYQVLQRAYGKDYAVVSKHKDVNLQFTIGGPHYFCGGSCPFYVGDIWVMAGGSNMQGLGYKTDFFTMKMLQQPVEHDEAFLFDSSEQWRNFENDPSHELTKSSRAVHDNAFGSLNKFIHDYDCKGASLAPAFVNTYKEINPGVPIALVPCAQDESTSDNWETNSKDPNSSLYGAMLDKIRGIGGKIAGILWYQGESDAKDSTRAKKYDAFFRSWVSELRKDLKQPNLPVAFVQIGLHNFTKPELKENWKKIQHAQFEMFGRSPYIAGIASSDAVLDVFYNLSAIGLSLVGRRLAYAADKALKGQGASATPLPSNAYVQKSSRYHASGPWVVMSIYLNFKSLDSPWKIEPNQPVVGFSFGEAEIPIIKAFVEDAKTGSIRLYLPDVFDELLKIHYGMQPGQANLITEDGRALPAFRNFLV
ncbi:hypothetical protein A0J61_10147 [Choanephora cucurbitarum]|uniref:Sialate O-acetylesterase domain-containing protein n=1 Tax=Choanephora cucurbitarum TaxID=101091 RepID=A0A1C7MY56_9FUNG|nr:hypothetical protein A0J61_10147 [Choanephora cucurbitarum]